MAKVKITAKQESVNRVSITHTTEGSELQLAFTLIATKDGFTVSGISTLRGHVAKPTLQHMRQVTVIWR